SVQRPSEISRYEARCAGAAGFLVSGCPNHRDLHSFPTRRSSDLELGAGVGIATGYATLGLVGFERRTDYAAIGTVTNLAARLCGDRKSTRLNSSHVSISYAVFCLKKKTLYYM